jgi:hypothetical protein
VDDPSKIKAGTWRAGNFYPRDKILSPTGDSIMQPHGADNYRHIEYHDSVFAFREIESLLCGKIIDNGAARRVYECRINPKWVVKREIGTSAQNVIEAEIWYYVDSDPEISKWLAPVHFASQNGLYLIQSRTTPIAERDRPKHLPAFLDCDLKLDNFGWLEDRIVCHDYGTLIAGLRRRGTRLVKAKWYA